MLVPTWTLFLDESGNAGPNYLDREQPFHVEGGLLVPDASLPLVRSQVAASLSKLPKEAVEIKAANLLKTTKWASLLATTLRAALQVPGVKVLFMIAERRFCLAGRVVDTFLDPDSNPAADFLPWGSVEARLAAWEAVALVSNEAHEEFAAAFRTLDPDALSRAAITVATNLDSCEQHRLAEACRQSVRHLDEIMRGATHWVNKGFAAGQVHSLNVPVCMHAAKLADRLFDSGPVRATFRLVHDQVDWFNEIFVHASTTLSGETAMPLELPQAAGPSVRTGLSRLHSTEVANSKSEYCLQLADIVASTVARILRACINGELKLSAGEEELAKLTMPLLYEQKNPHAGAIISAATKEIINERLARKGLVGNGGNA